MTADSSLQANRPTLAFRDMEDVKRYLAAYLELNAMQERHGDSRYFDHCEAALIAAIVANCRCFLHSESNGNASRLLKKTDLKCLQFDSTLSELHDRAIERRHTAIAHSDWTEHNTELLEVKGNSVFRRVSVPKLTHGIDPSDFLRLAEAVRTEVVASSHRLDTDGQRETVA